MLPAIRATRDVGRTRGARPSRAPRRELARPLRGDHLRLHVAARRSRRSARPRPSMLENPLTEQHDVMRTTLLPGLLDAVRRARRHGERDVRLFTAGAVFLAAQTRRAARRAPSFAAVLAGDRPSWLEQPDAVRRVGREGPRDRRSSRASSRRTAASIASRSRSDAPQHICIRAARRDDSRAGCTHRLARPAPPRRRRRARPRRPRARRRDRPRRRSTRSARSPEVRRRSRASPRRRATSRSS